MIRKLLPILLVGCSSSLAFAQEQKPLTPEEMSKITDKLASSLVQVEWTAQHDNGEAPGGNRWGAWRAYSVNNDNPDSWADWTQFIKQERPKSIGGFLIDATHVYSADPELHPRFLKSVKVRFGQNVVDAKPSAYTLNNSGLILELQSPLPATQALSFDPTKSAPYLAVTYSLNDGVWTTAVKGAGGEFLSTSDGRKFAPGSGNCLIIDRAGTPVALGTGDFNASGNWKLAAKDLPTVSSAELSKIISTVEKSASSCVLRTVLNFRSPRSDSNGGGRFGRYNMEQDDQVTEWNGLSLVVDPNSILVLAKFTPKTTGRLEKITVYLPDGRPVTCKFQTSLKDWGAFWVTPDEPLSAPAMLSKDDILTVRDRLLIKADISVRGETRTAYFNQTRIPGYFTAFRGRVFPAVSAVEGESSYYSNSGGSKEAINCYFDTQGTLIAIPLERREQVAAMDRSSWYSSGESTVAPAGLISELASDRKTSADPENRPLTEEEENRLAWLGVEMQPMDPELARANDIIVQTNGGTSGGIVTHIYPDSPAAKAEVQMGDIILRLHIDGQPMPLEVSLGDQFDMSMMDQLWAQLDRIPTEYFEQMPRPWGSAETTLTRALTDVGFGTKFTAEILRDGKLIKKDFVVTQGPKNFESAARYKTPESIGLTVRELTYEVRRYFQMSPDEPGVIISKIESGSRAAVAGLKPMEILRTANDQPITSVKDIENLVKQGGEIKFGVKRMTKGRTVKVKFDSQPDENAQPGHDEDPNEDADRMIEEPSEHEPTPDAGRRGRSLQPK